MRSGSLSTKSSETSSHELGRVETGMSARSTDTNGAPLSTISLPDQIPESLQEEGGTDSNEEDEQGEELEKLVASVRRIKACISNGSLRNYSRPTDTEMLGARDPPGYGLSPFRPSAESWGNATAEAIAHLEATGVIPEVPEVPEVPHFSKKSSLSNNWVTSSSSFSPSRVGEFQVEISAESHFKQVAPGVSLYSPSPSKQTGLTSLYQTFQSQQSSKPVKHYLPESHSPTPSDRSTELPYRRTREKKQPRQKGNVAVYSPIPGSDHSAEHEEEEKEEQKLALPRAPYRPHRAEGYPGRPASRQKDPLGDPPRYAARSPIPGPTINASPHAPYLPTTQTHEKRWSLTSDDTILNIGRYAFPDAPSHSVVRFPFVSQHTPQNRRKEETVVVVEGGTQQSGRVYEHRQDDYPLNPPPYGTAQSPGKALIDPGALYRNQRYQAKRDVPDASRDDPRANGIPSSPVPASSSDTDASYRTQGLRALQTSRLRPPEHHSFLPSPESRSISPRMDRTRPQDYCDDATIDRRPSAITDEVSQARPPSSAGHSPGFDRRRTVEHGCYYHTRRSQSKPRNLPVMSSPRQSLMTPPVPPIPLSHGPDERGPRYHGTFEPRYFRAFDGQYSPNDGSQPLTHSPISTSVVTPYDESFDGSTVQSLSQLSTIYDPQDELDDREVNFVSVRAHYGEDDEVCYSKILGEYRQNKGGGTTDRDLLKERGRGILLEAAEALSSARAGTPGSIQSPNLTNTTTPVFKTKVNSIELPGTPVRPARSLKMPSAEDEVSIHVDELNVPSRKPLSRMEKALLRRVEFGSNVDHSKLQLA